MCASLVWVVSLFTQKVVFATHLTPAISAMFNVIVTLQPGVINHVNALKQVDVLKALFV